MRIHLRSSSLRFSNRAAAPASRLRQTSSATFARRSGSLPGSAYLNMELSMNDTPMRASRNDFASASICPYSPSR